MLSTSCPFSSSGPRPVALLLLFLLPSAAVAQATGASVQAGLSTIDHTNIAVVINAADPLSVATGEYYVRARRIPAPNVIRIRFAAGLPEMSVAEFLHLKASVDAAAPSNVRAYALTWGAPYRVGCMSMTSAFAFGYDRSYCASGCAPTKPSAYFNAPTPLVEMRVRPAMIVSGHSFVETKALIDRGVQSDGSFPRGTAYLLLTTDKARNSRVPMYPRVTSVATGLIGIEILKQDTLVDRKDVLFYFTGLASVAGLDTLHFLPGAIADHLTSFGGMLTDSGQMSALRWLQSGATGSYGTVVEPCNFPQKFADPAIVIGHYLRGETLIEAYWKSVAWPGQGVFVGEPLAAPFRPRR